ncbi:hypothetical protein OROMI_012518 [Orobanche minor]
MLKVLRPPAQKRLSLGESTTTSLLNQLQKHKDLLKNIVDLTDSAIVKKKKEYQQPWPLDYHHIYYPNTLPLRRPYSGNPDITQVHYRRRRYTPRMLVFMFHSNLPLGKQPISANRRETYDNLKILENQPKVDKQFIKPCISSPKSATLLENLHVLYRNDALVQAIYSCDAMHHERRIMLKQEIGRMLLFFTDQPSLLTPNIQMVFSALAFAQSEVLWYFQHVGTASWKSKTAQVVMVETDPNDPTIGLLLDGMDRFCCVVRKYIAAMRGFDALSYLSSCAGRIRFLLGTPGMVALDLDAILKGLFQRIVQHLENIPKPQVTKCNLERP